MPLHGFCNAQDGARIKIRVLGRASSSVTKRVLEAILCKDHAPVNKPAFNVAAIPLAPALAALTLNTFADFFHAVTVILKDGHSYDKDALTVFMSG